MITPILPTWLIITIALTMISIPELTLAASQFDRALLISLENRDLDKARQLLEDGADPETVIGKGSSGSALCTAIDNRGTKFLELLLNYGASPNAKTGSGRYGHGTPLACSIEHYNSAAFKLLLDKGAQPDTNLCPKCEPQFLQTALTYSLVTGNYPFALVLVQLYPLNPVEIEKLVADLQESPFDQSHPWNDEREALIAWVKKNNIPLNARPSSAPVAGTKPGRCVFSTRDMEEGLSEGTVCE